MGKRRRKKGGQRLPEEGRPLRGRVRGRQREAPLRIWQDEGGSETKLRKLLADRDEGAAYDSENLTVGDYLDRWLGVAAGPDQEAPTVDARGESEDILSRVSPHRYNARWVSTPWRWVPRKTRKVAREVVHGRGAGIPDASVRPDSRRRGTPPLPLRA